jgi:UDP-glucose:(heptosyl)LPS alpha-1,3-glucosyltransferase
MRLAIVRQRYTPYGGAERFVEGALEALLERGIAISLYTRAWPQMRLQLIEPVICNPFYIGRLWRDWSFARRVCREVARNPPELVQSHERLLCCDVYRAGDGVHAQWLAERSRVQGPFARLATSLSPHHRYVLAAERALFTGPRLKAVICNSEMVRGEIATRFGTAPEKLVLIRNAVDSETFHPGLRGEMRVGVRQQIKIPEDANVTLHVGSGFERKGVAAMLEAVARSRAKPWALVVGRDKRASQYATLAQRLGIAERVRFVGAVSDVRPYYAAADTFVLASLYDPQPNAALEAMACGLPVVTSTKCGAAELLVEGESGFVRDALDVAGIASVLDTLEGGVALRIGKAARAAVERYTPAAMAREYLDLYRRLLRR